MISNRNKYDSMSIKFMFMFVAPPGFVLVDIAHPASKNMGSDPGEGFRSRAHGRRAVSLKRLPVGGSPTGTFF
ncbi:hypothetical protein [Candidatus Kuenenia sp.]|uniref:hypothetical protein n=1 Tax=Candidatus Kuenenia sp. TaxID=2499824 RepID=UPI0032204D20